MFFRDHVSSNCPPENAQPCDGTFYRFLIGKDVQPNDFLSIRELSLNKRYDEAVVECQACGLSVLSNLSEVRRLQRLSKVFRGKVAASAHLKTQHGVIQATPSQRSKSHHTWWINRAIDPVPDFTVI